MANLTESSADSIPRPVVQAFYLSKYNVILVATLIIIGTICIFANLTVFSFYKSRTENITHRLYTLLAAYDILSGISSILNALTLALLMCDQAKVINIFMPVTFCISAVTSLIPVFISVTLAVVRTINIIKPIYVINRKMLYGLIISYQAVWLPLMAFECYNLYRSPSVHFEERFYLLIVSRMVGAEAIYEIKGGGEPAASVYLSVAVGIPFVLPSVICAVCAAVQIYSLVRSSEIGSVCYIRNRRITMTVTQLTSVFIVCNTFGFVAGFISVIMVPVTKNSEVTTFWLYLIFVATTIGPFINSAINPIILITRGRTLKKYASEIYKLKVRNSVT